MAVVRNVVVRIGADISELTRGLQNAERTFQSLGNNLRSAGETMSKYVTLPIMALGAGIIKTAADFEQGMSNIKAVSGEGAENMQRLKDLALQMGKETKYSAKEAAQGIEELLKAGLTTEQVLGGGLKGALSLATAGELELGEAAEIASTALNAFRADNLNVQQAADILAGAANASATSVQEMRFSLQMVSAVASAVGMSFKDTSTAIAVFAQNGLKGSDAGTSLKTMLMNLQPTTDKQAKLFQKLNLVMADGTSKFFDARGKLKSLAEISRILKNSMSDLSDAQRLQAMDTIFGSDAIRAANILYKEGAEGVEAMAQAMSKVGADQVAAEKMNNFNGSLEQLKGSLETLGIQLGTILLPPLRSFVDKLTELTNSFMTLSPETQKTILIFAGIAGAIGPVLIAIGMLSNGISAIIGLVGIITPAFSTLGAIILGIPTAISSLIAIVSAFIPVALELGAVTTVSLGLSYALDALAVIFGILTNPIVLVVAAIVALGASFMELWNTNEEFRTNMLNIWNDIQVSLASIWDSIKTIASAVWEGLKLFWKAWGNDILAWFEILWETIGGVLRGAFEVIKGIFNIFAGVFSGDWSRVWTGVKEVFGGIWEVIVIVIAGALMLLYTVLLAVWTTIKDNILVPVYNWLSETFKFIFDAIYQKFSEDLSLTLLIIESTWSYLYNNVLLPVYTWLSETFKAIWDTINSKFKTALEDIKSGINTTWTFIKDKVLSPVYDWLVKTFQPIFDTIKTALNNAWGGLSATVKGIWDTISDTIKNSINYIIGLINSLIDKISSIKIDVPKVSVPGMGDFGGYSIGFPKIDRIPALANGGMVDSPTLALIGEAGPEAVVPLDRMNEMGGGNVIQVILDGRVIQEYVDNGLGRRLTGLGAI